MQLPCGTTLSSTRACRMISHWCGIEGDIPFAQLGPSEEAKRVRQEIESVIAPSVELRPEQP